jgi:hypothetical protein
LKSGKCCPKAFSILRTGSVGLGFLRKGNYILVLALEPHGWIEEFSGHLIKHTYTGNSKIAPNILSLHWKKDVFLQ